MTIVKRRGHQAAMFSAGYPRIFSLQASVGVFDPRFWERTMQKGVWSLQTGCCNAIYTRREASVPAGFILSNDGDSIGTRLTFLILAFSVLSIPSIWRFASLPLPSPPLSLRLLL